MHGDGHFTKDGPSLVGSAVRVSYSHTCKGCINGEVTPPR